MRGTRTFIERRRADSTAFERRLWTALEDVPDPHIPVSLVEMAMIYDVHEADGHVSVEMSYPCMGCPAYGMIQEDIEERLLAVEDVESVTVTVTWEPVWTKEMLTADVREQLAKSGISL